ncbi:MAG: class I SAM-dependent methyltransferase [Chloroflexi bacterium]|nr:class I SAM-dependent methyltransferase [Chloroflexota bacterium]MXW27523.1 class I SAM-dependent methyltransferase [Chloroflexota bacterium]MXX65428.1 class I SAM-dependent methyltransferase [Chloroflexota bacterium]MXX99352.1 class I SAM-dependent methyltransferase [Chloroflexota bacterium]MYB15939.1 class I SAM-dependent methyltransferase [Chloroflexota bacterium]
MDNRRAYDDVAAHYDLEYPGPRTGELEFWQGQLPAPDSKVLELACGSGRLLAPLARGGAVMTGIDSSPAMLARARERLRADPAVCGFGARLHLQSMQDLELEDEFSLVMAAFNALLLVPHRELPLVLERVRSHLDRGGKLVAELFAMTGFDALPDEESAPLAGGSGSWWRDRSYRYDPDLRAGISHVSYRHGRGRIASQHSYGLHLHSWPELETQLVGSGFWIESLYGGFDRRPFRDAGGQLIFVARPSD